MQESRLYTGIPKWRERLGIEPNRLIIIFEFREKCDHFGSIIHSYYRTSSKQKTRWARAKHVPCKINARSKF